MKHSRIIAADLFCGAGGTSSGLVRACDKRGLDLDLLAVNHWQVAIDTHTSNHPDARHICARLDQIRPEDAVPGGRMHLLVASPECTHHSNARGGRPMNDQSRATAWDILNWLQKIYVDNVLIENVKEFQNWGPLGANGRPLKSKRGETFQQWLRTIESLGYRVESRVLNSADYGAATTRERLFIIARRGNKKIVWPEPTHAPRAEEFETLFESHSRKPWRAAREIIDWSIPGKSILTRKKPLADATLRRIEAGLRKFGGANAEPFLVVLRNHQHSRSLNDPLPPVTTSGAHFAVCEPFVIGQQSGATARSVGEPVPTVSTAGAISLVQPFIMAIDQQGSRSPQVLPVDVPMHTVTTKSRTALVEPFVVPFFGERNGQEPRSHSIDSPLPTITGHGAGALIEPFIVPQFSDSNPRSVNNPLGTITTTSRGVGLCEPYITEFYGNGDARSIDAPLSTVTTKDRFGLAMPEHNGMYIDIRFRMLQPHELSAAMGFEKDYRFTGNREAQVKQIGNAVEGHIAEALCASLLSDYGERRAA